MIADLHKVSGALAAGLIQLTDRSVIPQGELQAGSESKGDADEPVSATWFAGLFEQLAARTGVEKVGLRMANAFRLGDTGAFGLGLMNAPTFGDAVELYCEFLPLVADHATFDLAFGTKTVEIAWQYSPFLLERMNYVDFCMLLTLRQFRQFAGESWSPLSVQLKRPKSIDARPYREAFSAHTEFGAPANYIEISTAVLNRRNPSADPRIYKQMRKLCEFAMDRKRQSATLSCRLNQSLLMGLVDREFSLERTAKSLGIGVRQLQRRLSSEGQTFEGLVNSARKEYSSHLLQYTDDSIEEVGNKLGYSGANAYSRIASQWYGISPSKHRAALRLN